MWLDLYTFSNYKDFIAACRWLHRDEDDPEFAYLNFENYPSEWYSTVRTAWMRTHSSAFFVSCLQNSVRFHINLTD